MTETPLPAGDDLGGYGAAVAISGDTLVAAAHDFVSGNPAVFFFCAQAGGWTLAQEIPGPVGFGNLFGASVTISGDTAVVGNPADDELGVDAGAVHVFDRAGGVWTQGVKLLPVGGVSSANFGWSVAIDGNTLVVGARGDGELGDQAGAAYVFVRSAGIWTQAGKLLGCDTTTLDHFGGTVSVSGDTILVGAPLHDESFDDSGGAYVFVKSGSAWTQQTELIAVGPEVDGHFGFSVSISGETALIGVEREDGSSVDQGAAHVFVRNSDVWTLEAELVASDGAFNDHFGFSVAIRDDRALIGVGSLPVDNAYLFSRSEAIWTERARLNPLAGAHHQVSVALESGVAVVGQGDGFFFSGSLSVYDFMDPDGSVAFRNAGTNPVSYSATSAAIGEDLTFTIDLTTTGHDQALVIGFDSPFGITLGGGQTLLCLDLLGSGGELINTGFHTGPIAVINLSVPNEPALRGFQVCTQAVHAFGVVPFALSNAQDIVIGACL